MQVAAGNVRSDGADSFLPPVLRVWLLAPHTAALE